MLLFKLGVDFGLPAVSELGCEINILLEEAFVVRYTK